MRATSILLLAATPLLIPAANAEIYRWVDENGVVNYTQMKPEGQAAVTVDPRASRPSGSETAPTEAEDVQPDSDLSAEQQAMLEELQAREADRQAQVAEIRQDNCSKARSVLQKLTATARVRSRDANGQERVMPETERQERIGEAQAGIATNCDSLDG